jgi:hypothetical protein
MVAPLKPPASAAFGTASARDWALRVNTGTEATPVWVFVNGLSKITATTDQTFKDDSDLNAAGFKSELATGTGFVLNLEGLRKGTLAAGVLTPDPGQEFLRAKGLLTGYANICSIQWWRTDDLPESYTGSVAVDYTEGGGGPTDLQDFKCVLKGRGASTVLVKPTTA